MDFAEDLKDLSFQEKRYMAQDPLSFYIYLEELSKDDDWRIRAAVGGNPATPSETLSKLSEDPHLLVRKRVAGNPSTLTEDLLKMKKIETYQLVLEEIRQSLEQRKDQK